MDDRTDKRTGSASERKTSSFSRGEVSGMFDGSLLQLYRKLSLPIFFGMLFQLLYGIVDTIWISRIDLNDASYVGGTGIIFPLFFLVIAIGSGILIGIGSVVARSIGEKNRTLINSVAESGVVVGLIPAFLLAVLGYSFDEQIIRLLGAEGDYYIHALEYFRFLLPAGCLTLLGTVFNGILQGEGLMKKVMISVMIATLANIILDPVFIFLLDMKVKGAGLATVLSQLIAGTYIISIFARKKTIVPMAFTLKTARLKVIWKIVSIGFPQTAGQMTMAVSFLFFNRLIIRLDSYALTAFTICGRFDQALLMPIMAIGSALITMTGQNYGRGKFERVKQIWNVGLLCAVAVVLFLAALLFVFAPRIIPFFSDVNRVIRYGILQMRIIEFTYLFAAVAELGRSAFQAVGKPLPALIITALRFAIAAVPLAYIYVFVFHMGVYGIWFGIISGNVIAAGLGLLWVNRVLGELAQRKIAIS
jgi:putative MATE family efflux protein